MGLYLYLSTLLGDVIWNLFQRRGYFRQGPNDRLLKAINLPSSPVIGLGFYIEPTDLARGDVLVYASTLNAYRKLTELADRLTEDLPWAEVEVERWPLEHIKEPLDMRESWGGGIYGLVLASQTGTGDAVTVQPPILGLSRRLTLPLKILAVLGLKVDAPFHPNLIRSVYGVLERQL